MPFNYLDLEIIIYGCVKHTTWHNNNMAKPAFIKFELSYEAETHAEINISKSTIVTIQGVHGWEITQEQARSNI